MSSCHSDDKQAIREIDAAWSQALRNEPSRCQRRGTSRTSSVHFELRSMTKPADPSFTQANTS